MLRNCRQILWVVVAFLAIGIAYGQVNLSCETFCLSKKTVCTCTLAQNSLTWELINGSVDLGERTVDDIDDLNQPKVLLSPNSSIRSSFEIIVTSSTSEAITATMSFITLSEYQGYDIRCTASFTNFSTIPIAIPGFPSMPEVEVASFATDSVMLTFVTPNNSDCLANYTITTTADASSSTTDNIVTITKPSGGGHVEGDTYSVSVSAVDFAGRTGPPYSLDCFMFDGPNAVMLTNGVNFMYMNQTQNDTCVAQFEWMVKDCLPEATGYQIIASSADVAAMVNETVNATTFALQNVSSGEVYSVTIVPSNTLGFGMTTSTIFTVPTSCTESTTGTTTESIPSSGPTTSSSASPADTSGISASAIAAIVVGSIAAIAACFIVVLLTVIIVVKIKRKKEASYFLSKESVALNAYEKHGQDTVKYDEGSEQPAPEKPKRTHRQNQEMKPEDTGNNHAASQGFYADISHDKSKSAQPPPKNDQKVTYSDISNFHQPQYADLDVARGGRKIPQKQEAVVYSELKQ